MDTKVPNSDTGYFLLAETRAAPGDQRLKQELEKDETFETGFIGASEQDCQAWAMEMQYRVNYIEQDIIAILDARSARDGTVLLQCYVHEKFGLGEEGELGVFPEEAKRWYDFRIDIRYTFKMSVYFEDQMDWPVLFGLKEELTDAHGVFDAAKAERICCGKEPGYDVV